MRRLGEGRVVASDEKGFVVEVPTELAKTLLETPDIKDAEGRPFRLEWNPAQGMYVAKYTR